MKNDSWTHIILLVTIHSFFKIKVWVRPTYERYVTVWHFVTRGEGVKIRKKIALRNIWTAPFWYDWV